MGLGMMPACRRKGVGRIYPRRLQGCARSFEKANCDLSTYVGIYKDQVPPVAPRTFDAAWTDDSRHQPYPALAVLTKGTLWYESLQ